MGKDTKNNVPHCTIKLTGLHMKRDQEAEGGDSPPLIYSCEVPSGELRPGLEPPT